MFNSHNESVSLHSDEEQNMSDYEDGSDDLNIDDSEQDNCEQTNERIVCEERSVIETKCLKEYKEDLDNNHGNVAFIVKDYPLAKKPSSSRKIINWGSSQTQRGKTTLYPCAGYFECENCEEKYLADGKCNACKAPLKQRICNATNMFSFAITFVLERIIKSAEVLNET